MLDGHIPKQLIYSKLSTGKRFAGVQKRFKDSRVVETLPNRPTLWNHRRGTTINSCTSGARIAEK
jgi:hypothetical protein